MENNEDYEGFNEEYNTLLNNTELLYENLGDLDIDTLEYLIYICEIIISSKQWKEG